MPSNDYLETHKKQIAVTVMYYLVLIMLPLEHKAVVAAYFALAIIQLVDQIMVRLNSQLINSTSRVLQKLLEYFKGTTILLHL